MHVFLKIDFFLSLRRHTKAAPLTHPHVSSARLIRPNDCGTFQSSSPGIVICHSYPLFHFKSPQRGMFWVDHSPCCHRNAARDDLKGLKGKTLIEYSQEKEQVRAPFSHAAGEINWSDDDFRC